MIAGGAVGPNSTNQFEPNHCRYQSRKYGSIRKGEEKGQVWGNEPFLNQKGNRKQGNTSN